MVNDIKLHVLLALELKKYIIKRDEWNKLYHEEKNAESRKWSEEARKDADKMIFVIKSLLKVIDNSDALDKMIDDLQLAEMKNFKGLYGCRGF